MKKLTAILLTICILFSLSGCVSQSDYDALVAQQETLQADFDALQATLDKYADLIGAIDAEDYGAAMHIISEKQIAKQLEEKGDIDNYLVTVELTKENFDEYFEWKPFYNLDDFGENIKSSMSMVASSKVYDQELIVYDTDVRIGYDFTYSETEKGYTFTDTFHSTMEWIDGFISGTGIGSSDGVVYHLDECYIELTRVEGTVTFVKEEYVTSYEHDKDSQSATITLVNGETLYHNIPFGCHY